MCEETSAKPASVPKSGAAKNRDARLKSALKANMAKRKAQARARAAQDGAADNKGPDQAGGDKG